MTTSLLSRIAVLVFLGACASNSPSAGPEPVVRGGATDPADRVMLARTRWQSSALLTRSDSVVLTLPSGDRQVQRMSRRARFSIQVDDNGGVRVQLDSITFTPAVADRARDVVGTVWQGRLSSEGLGDLRASRSGPLVDDLTGVVRELFPALPTAGVSTGATWSDTTTGERKVEIFKAEEIRVSEWRVSPRTQRDGLMVLPVRVTQRYEQQGTGEQAGRDMSMTAQGSRTATYYLTLGGRLDALTVVDSASKLITIPSTRQAIPTMQYIRSQVEFRAPGSR